MSGTGVANAGHPAMLATEFASLTIRGSTRSYCTWLFIGYVTSGSIQVQQVKISQAHEHEEHEEHDHGDHEAGSGASLTM